MVFHETKTRLAPRFHELPVNPFHGGGVGYASIAGCRHETRAQMREIIAHEGNWPASATASICCRFEQFRSNPGQRVGNIS
jgi:hypothetical protein